ncbi:MAG: N-acetylglucosamine-6-phosphate deacetylase, partial [Dysgonamonadaceae bacterium]|nr:N-acetylglucosamine-6-phosphate deacetylase [Dysgonamonadaceae bacterium]
MSRLIITNGKIVFPDLIIEDSALVCKNGYIKEIKDISKIDIKNSDIVIDAKQNYISPGFVDIHTHGGGGHDFMDATVEAYLGAA